MKTTVVPAQVTTVEDKVAGSLSFTQLILLTVPIFADSALFILFPPLFKLSPLKFVAGITLALICFVLAFRIRGKLILQWILVLVRYNARPTYYVYNKNDLYLRDARPEEAETAEAIEVPEEVIATEGLHAIPTPELVRLQSAVSDPRSRFHFKVTKGGLRVHINEVKD